MLGSQRDADENAQRSELADGDDNNPIDAYDDEDGVVFSLLRVGQLDAFATVTVQSAPTGAKLDAWIDFDLDGNWDGPGEQIAKSLSVSNGENTVRFDVPSQAVSGLTYARFRLSSTGNLHSVVGSASDGEIEDYRIEVLSPVASAGFFAPFQTIASDKRLTTVLGVSDLDSDGDMDLISASARDGDVIWFENLGGAQFVSHTIDSSFGGPTSIFPSDVDRDGDIDLLATGTNSSTPVVWYENDGNQNFVRINIPANVSGARSIYAADFDSDGETDVVVASSNDDRVTWFKNRGNENFQDRVLTTFADGASFVAAGNFDQLGRINILSVSPNDGSVVWYPNNDNNSSQYIARFEYGVQSAYVADLNGDGRQDVVAGNRWYRATAFVGAFVGADFADSDFATAVADLDGDGDVDILARNTKGEDLWYENFDNASEFLLHKISINVFSTSIHYPADLDGDGDLDIVFANDGTRQLGWYENLDFVPPSGDYDLSGTVDQADYQVWRSTFGSTMDLRADGNNDGMVEASDYTVWRDHLGETIHVVEGSAAAIGVSAKNSEPGHGTGVAFGEDLEEPEVEPAVASAAMGMSAIAESQSNVNYLYRWSLPSQFFNRHSTPRLTVHQADNGILAWLTANRRDRVAPRRILPPIESVEASETWRDSVNVALEVISARHFRRI